jgi:hypothetical protein
VITRKIIYTSRVRGIEDAVEAWKSSHDDVMEIGDLEDVLREWLWTTDLLIEWQMSSWQLLLAGKLKKILAVGRMLRMAFKSSLDVSLALDEWVKSAEGKGYVVDHAGPFRTRAVELEQLCRRFEARWPAPDTTQMEAALASLNRGEGEDLEGWIHELQGEDSPGG